MTRSWLSYLIVTALIMLLPTITAGQSFSPPQSYNPRQNLNAPQSYNPLTRQSLFFHGHSSKNSVLELGLGYSFGFNWILFRDGDNANFPPSKKDIPLDGLAFGLQGQTFVTSDLAVRAQGWINIPQKLRSDFVLYPATPTVTPGLTPTTTSWDSSARCIEGDLSASYFFGLCGMPYAAGLTAGYRYLDLSYDSVQVSAPSGTFQDHFQVHIPYLGVYYGHTELVGSTFRLDIIMSPFPLARLDSNRLQVPLPVRISGSAVTGVWFETLFEFSVPTSSGVFFGTFAKFNYLELNGGATMADATKIHPILHGFPQTPLYNRSELVLQVLIAAFFMLQVSVMRSDSKRDIVEHDLSVFLAFRSLSSF